jgi:hypothetical protein
MHLLGYKKFRLCYCLVNTPEALVEKEQRSYFWKFGGNEVALEENHHYQGIIEQVQKNHKFDHIPERLRVKVFELDYDPAYMKELVFRADAANDYYHTLKLDEVLEGFEQNDEK